MNDIFPTVKENAQLNINDLSTSDTHGFCQNGGEILTKEQSLLNSEVEEAQKESTIQSSLNTIQAEPQDFKGVVAVENNTNDPSNTQYVIEKSLNGSQIEKTNVKKSLKENDLSTNKTQSGLNSTQAEIQNYQGVVAVKNYNHESSNTQYVIENNNKNTTKTNSFKRVLIGFKNFFLKNLVFFIALILAGISCFFTPPDKEYLHYIDYKTIVSLFCMLLVIAGLRNIYFFRILARKIVKVFKNTRSVILTIVLITYFSSMLIANDMALITFLPLSAIILSSTNKKNYIMFTFIMQTVSANLGGMLIPFGNPQNLYLYNYFNIGTIEFFKIMYIPFLVATALIIITLLFVKKENLEFDEVVATKLNKTKAIIYLVLFVYAIIIVFRVVPYLTGLLMLPIFLILDRDAIKNVDYMLLLTFCMFFIFAGNIARIEVVSDFLGEIVQKNVLLSGVISCQFISNVPSTILLSNFTTDYKSLLLAVNIGGVGTLISSLASLITFKEFCKIKGVNKWKYLMWFTIINFSFLIILTLLCFLII